MKEIVLGLKSAQEINLEIVEDSLIKAIYVGRGEDLLKTKIYITHSSPSLTSRVLIKAVVFDSARFDLEGVLQIKKGAVGTDTYLKVDCLVMSEKAFARAVPSLEINESDVKGGHGATIGYLDPEMMYYLKSRGLASDKAEELLIDAFINS